VGGSLIGDAIGGLGIGGIAGDAAAMGGQVGLDKLLSGGFSFGGRAAVGAAGSAAVGGAGSGIGASAAAAGAAVAPFAAAAAAEYATQMKIARGDTIATAEDASKALGRAESQSQAFVQLGRSQLSLVEQEARMRLDGADKYIGRLKKGKSVAEDTIRTLSEGLKSGKERFAAMSDEDQQSTLLAGEKARVDPLSLSDKERGLLRSVGTQQAQQAASFADVKEADSKGFNRVFGGEERQQIAAAQQQVQRVNLEVTNATQFKVDVQLRAQEVSQAISLDLKSIIAESNKQVVAMVQREVAASEQRIRAENAKTNIVRR